jgi:hypothetical protein
MFIGELETCEHVLRPKRAQLSQADTGPRVLSSTKARKNVRGGELFEQIARTVSHLAWNRM